MHFEATRQLYVYYREELDDECVTQLSGRGHSVAEDTTLRRIIVGILLIASLVVLFWLLSQGGALAILKDRAALEYIAQWGMWGPVAVILLIASTIVWSPLPSIPVALAAGAAYGRTWGTIYVLIGAELGAVVAFAIARLLGHDTIKRWLGRRLPLGSIGSQNARMAFVFFTRLLPFMSFDLISYAAGLTSLSTWRFAIATLAGAAPISFLLAHFGSEMASGDARRIATAMLILGGFTFVALAAKLALDRRRRQAENRNAVPLSAGTES